jgi:multidrug transporter EmrE-like cation transporter
MIGALLLVSAGADVPRSAAYWVLAGLYICGAAFFSYLLFFSSGLSRPAR